MKIGIFLVCFIITSFAFANELKFIHFKTEGEIGKLELEFSDDNINANKFHNAEDKQIIIDLKNTTSTDRTLRGFDASEFAGSVGYVRAYIKETNSNDIRIAVQLRENVRSLMQKRGNRLILSIENRFGVFTQTKIENEEGVKLGADREDEGVKIHIPKSDSVQDILENLTLSGPKKYIGKKISLNVKHISVADILDMIAESSGFNIIMTEEVKALPTLSLTLTNIPWDQILDEVLGLNKLVAKKNSAILVITSLKRATEEKKLEIEAKKLSEKEEPLVTKIFPLSFATTKSMTAILKDYLTDKRGAISVDERTNALIVKDTADVIEKVRKIVEVLDTQTPQVLIQSKIVEVNEDYSKNLGLKEGLKFQYDPVGEKALTKAAVGVTPGNTEEGGPGFSFNSAPSEAGDAVLGLVIGRFSRLFNLNFQLEMMESENKGKIISSPKVITQNKKKAKIKSEETLPYVSVTDQEAGTTEWKELVAALELEVTPQITNDGSIVLDVNIMKEEFRYRPDSLSTPVPMVKRNVKTQVLIDNGSTVVIGGVYKTSTSKGRSGIPFLKDLPILGWLFRTPDRTIKEKSEMIIFLTPRIINQEEAGLVDSAEDV